MGIDSALILCAGYGKRLKPITDYSPKPLLNVRGKPMVCNILDKLIGAGIKKFFINTFHLAEKFDSQFPLSSDGKRHYKNAEIILVRERGEILDTGGALKNILSLIDRSKPILVHNGDIFFDADPKPFIAQSYKNFKTYPSCSATLCLRGGGNLSNVCVRGNNVVDMRFELKKPFDAVMQFCGFYAANPPLFNLLEKEPNKAFSIIETLLEAIRKNENQVFFFAENSGIWTDIGSPPEYIKINGGAAPDRNFRLAQLLSYGFFPEKTSEIDKGGSMREFFKFEDPKYGKLVACFYSPEKRENLLYAPIAKFLKGSEFPVPEILYDSEQDRSIVMGDAGETSLCEISEDKKESAYEKVVASIVRLHTQITEKYNLSPFELSPGFDDNLYIWEQKYFMEECVKGRFGINQPFPEGEFKHIRQTLTAKAPSLLHRDLQSQNIILGQGGEISFIDFQGMRLGNPYYDLASLLFDPYAEISAQMRGELLKKYAFEKREPLAEAEKSLNIAAVERLMQALGAYGFLSRKKGLTEYENYFRPALSSLIDCALKCGFPQISSIASSCLKLLGEK